MTIELVWVGTGVQEARQLCQVVHLYGHVGGGHLVLFGVRTLHAADSTSRRLPYSSEVQQPQQPITTGSDLGTPDVGPYNPC
ncbi:hypothetical protein [Streptomyces pseudovenezuelae]|uniref:hypothetical protein n=1 Tax=Streptomyces pseudovenezuelae TaxID=67350 RepID=UPI002E7FCBA2|nr:hypothetical protein [Streptomyces pseudovenezuelae]WUA94405.1 hypothetical protein OHO81_22985 [Streptomyces pseudovenezuelae]